MSGRGFYTPIQSIDADCTKHCLAVAARFPTFAPEVASFMKFNPYGIICRIANHPIVSCCADITPIAVTTYVGIWKPMTGITLRYSLGTFLVEPVANFAMKAIVFLVITFAGIRAFQIYLKHYGEKKPLESKLEEHPLIFLSAQNNKDIRRHIQRAELPGFGIAELPGMHHFDQNLDLILVLLQRELVKKLSEMGHNIEARHIWLTLFSYQNSANEASTGQCFELRTLVGPNSAKTETRKIFLGDQAHKDFAGVRAITSKPANILCVTKCSGRQSVYIKGACVRRKNVKHYFGVPIETNDKVSGLLNIEVHNVSCFATDEEMQTFAENELYGFRCSLEYQFLKDTFFGQLSQPPAGTN